MWCKDCQQDVPAVAKSTEGPLVCTRCEAQFEHAEQDDQQASHPSDTGLLLEGYDRSRRSELGKNPWAEDETEDRLRRIGLQLRTAYRHQSKPGATRAPRRTWGPEALDALNKEQRLQAMRPSAGTKGEDGWSYTVASRFISLLLMIGVLGFILGVCWLVCSVAFGLPNSWQWGMTATIAAEGTLIFGLTWMALRLWHNSRQLNQQIDEVDQQIHELEHLTGSLAAGRLSRSQYYYTHYNQGASSHMLLANLEGQVEQLSTRLAG